jgi:GTPase SAR1 family protein
VSTPRSWLWAIRVRRHNILALWARIELYETSIGVGKTSLLHRYTQNKFDPKNTTSTTGAFFVTKKIDMHGVKVRLQLWDTAGQERFRSMVRLVSLIPYHKKPPDWFLQAPMYYRGAHAALLLYDITNLASFQAVRGWLEGMSTCVITYRPVIDVATGLRAQAEL